MARTGCAIDWRVRAMRVLAVAYYTRWVEMQHWLFSPPSFEGGIPL